MLIVFYTVRTVYIFVFMSVYTSYCLCNKLTDPWNICMYMYVVTTHSMTEMCIFKVAKLNGYK
jgi:hypothetical protein